MNFNKKITPLLPRLKIYGATWEDEDIDTTRFAKQFPKAWDQIPRHDRRLIQRYWRRCHASVTSSPGFEALRPEVKQQVCSALISIEVTNYMNGDTDSWLIREGRYVFGQSVPGRHQIQFWAPAVEAMPDDVLRIVILRQLFTIWAWEAWGGESDDIEEQTLERDWGVDRSLLQAWAEGPEGQVLLRDCGYSIEDRFSCADTGGAGSFPTSQPYLSPTASVQKPLTPAAIRSFLEAAADCRSSLLGPEGSSLASLN